MRPEEVLDFWFQELTAKDQFAKNERIDSEIRRRFLPVLQFASHGDLHDWRNSAQGRLATKPLSGYLSSRDSKINYDSNIFIIRSFKDSDDIHIEMRYWDATQPEMRSSF